LFVCWKDDSRKIHEVWKHIDVIGSRHFWETKYKRKELDAEAQPKTTFILLLSRLNTISSQDFLG